MTVEEIAAALRQSHPADLPVIKKYIAWVGFRRKMHNEFYLAVHWVSRPRSDYHWIST